MRVALVTQGFGPLGGGQERWVYQFAQGLLERGAELEIITRRIHGHLAHSKARIHLLELPTRNPFRFANAAESILRQLRCDIVHDMGDGWGGDILQYHGGPYPLIAEHKLAMLPGFLRWAKRLLMQFLPHYRLRYRFAAEQFVRHQGIFAALSQRQAAEIGRLYPQALGRTRIIYNGVDVVHYSPAWRVQYREPIRNALGVTDKTTVFLIAASNFRLKGVPTLIRAGRLLARKRADIHIIVIGGTRTRKDTVLPWRRTADGLVTFIGWVDDLRPYYAAADVYVHPTFFDCCSLAVLEALASGLPVITTPQNGASELLTGGCDGYVLPDPQDVHALADLMEKLTDKRLCAEMGKAAREKALLHRFDRNVEAFWQLYETIRQNSLVVRCVDKVASRLSA